VGIAGALVLVAGGTAAAATADSKTAELTTSLAGGSPNALAQDDLRNAAANRADRTRTAQVSAAAAAGEHVAQQRAAWLAKSTASQRALALKLSTEIVGGDEVDLTASTLATKKAALERAAATVKTATAAKPTASAAVTVVSTSGRYVLPVSSGVNSDTFGRTGVHWANRHTGQDFPVPLGTDVRAVSSGKVLETGWAGAFGNRMRLLLDDGTEIWYCHLSSYVVTSGRVSAGQIVARSGSTGNSTGPHLHMEVHLNQNPVASDPLNWLRSKGLSI